MGKINIGKLFASFVGCFFLAAVGVSGQPHILPEVSPSLQALDNLFTFNISEPVLLILSGIGLIAIASAARERLKD